MRNAKIHSGTFLTWGDEILSHSHAAVTAVSMWSISSNGSKYRVNPDDAQAATLHPLLLSIMPWEAPQILGLMSCCASGGWLQTLLEFQDLVWQISRQEKTTEMRQRWGKERRKKKKKKTGMEQRARRRDLGRQKGRGNLWGKTNKKGRRNIFGGVQKVEETKERGWRAGPSPQEKG